MCCASPNQEQLDCLKRYCSLMRAFPGHETPKLHLMAHMLKRVRLQGSYKLYGNWYDEHLNKELKASCRLASQSGFEFRVLDRMQDLLKAGRTNSIFDASEGE